MTGPWSKQLRSKRRGDGFPVGTVAFYGPDDRRATKVVAAIIPSENSGAQALKRWFSEDLDVRVDRRIGEAVLAYLRDARVRRVVATGSIFGCPHEEGIDYPSEGVCPKCPFWATHDRFKDLTLLAGDVRPK